MTDHTKLKALIDQLNEDAEYHLDMASQFDMRPQDTVNWRHSQNCTDASLALKQLTAENEALRTQVAELSKDAERYRWFADIAVNGYFDKAEKAFACFESAESCTKQELDAAIDAAIAKGAK